MHRSITPAFIKEPSRSVKMLKVILVSLATPKVHIGNLKVAPKMTGRVTVGLEVVVWSSVRVRQPFQRVVAVYMLRVRGEKLDGLGPERRNALWAVVEVDGEPICLVMVLHPSEDIVIDVTEEVYLGLHSPVIASICQRRMFVEQATVPSAHLMVGH